MSAEAALSVLLRAQLAGAAAILVVLLLRPLTRRVFGSETVYRLWLVPPVAAAAGLVPGALSPLPSAAYGAGVTASLSAFTRLVPAGAVLVLWTVGLALFLLAVLARHRAFLRLVRARHAGPAVIGVLCPRLVLPGDFSERFSPEEQGLIRLHERIHIARSDGSAILLIVLLQAAAWFNPLAHLAARLARFDQELACDAGVLGDRPSLRRAYAETLLKAHVGGAPPLGAAWGAGGAAALALRIRQLGREAPSTLAQLSGGFLTLVVAAACLATVIASQPAPAHGDPRAWWRKAPQVIFVDLSPRPRPTPG